MAKLPARVLEAFAPLDLERVVVGVHALALRRSRRKRPGVESGPRAELTRPDAVDSLDSNRVGSVGSQALQGVVSLRTGSGDDRVSGVDVVVGDVFAVGHRPLPGERESVGGGQPELEAGHCCRRGRHGRNLFRRRPFGSSGGIDGAKPVFELNNIVS